MKKSYNGFGGKSPQRKIVFGKDKGKNYSDVSHEIENTFKQWLSFSALSENEFDTRMKGVPHCVEESINAAGEVEINLYAGGERVVAPLVFQGGDIKSLDDFLVDAVLLLSFIASRYADKSFEKTVKGFMEKMIEQRKMSL